jgi:hypothetical protein
LVSVVLLLSASNTSLGMQWPDPLSRIVALAHLTKSSANATLETISDIFYCLEMSLNNQKNAG